MSDCLLKQIFYFSGSSEHRIGIPLEACLQFVIQVDKEPTYFLRINDHAISSHYAADNRRLNPSSIARDFKYSN